MADSEHFLHLVVRNHGVILGQHVLVALMVVEGTVVGFGMTVLWAEHVTTFAFSLNEANFAIACPALALVLL